MQTRLRRLMTIVASLAALHAVAVGNAQQTRPDPDADLKSLRAADGFEINLFAADPAIAKPIQMNFDHRGRLWVVSSESYPQLKPGERPGDKVFVLEDTDGDGRADRTSQYAGGLLIPTGIEIGPRGPFVGQSTELVQIAASNRPHGLVGERPVTVLSGFGTEDTHHLIHSFRWSPDGWLYFGQSIYIHSHVETPWGVQRLNGGGFWMFRPESHRLRVFVQGMVNSWGIAWDDFGQAFGVDNHDGPKGSPIKWFFPGSRFEFTPEESSPLKGIVFDKPKYCGAEFVVGEQFPREYLGNFVTCDFRAHRVVRYQMEDDGAGFRAVEREPLVSSLNPNFRPVDVKMGPDGALYICDWYNPIINHGEVDFRDPRRDRLHGRIWRVAAKGRKFDRQPEFHQLAVGDLVALQGSANGWTRHFARRALVERNPDEVVKAVESWIARSPDDRSLLAGLWTCEAVDRTNAPLLLRCLNSTVDPRVRAAAMRIAGLRALADVRLDAARLEQIRAGLVDRNARVRLEAIRALACADPKGAMRWSVQAYRLPVDRFLEHALQVLAVDSFDEWLPLVASELASAKSMERLPWVRPLLVVERAETVAPLLQLLDRGCIAPSDRTAVYAAIGRRGNSAQMALVLEKALSKQELSVSDRGELLSAVHDASRLRGVRPAGNLDDWGRRMLAAPHVDMVATSLRTIGDWRLNSMSKSVADRALKNTEPLKIRIAAVEALEKLDRTVAATALSTLAAGSVAPTTDRTLQNAAFAALANVDNGRAASLAMARLRTTSGAGAADWIAPLLRTKRGPAELAKVLAGKSLEPEVARAALRVANATGLLMPELLSALAKAGGLPASAMGPSAEAMRRLVRLAASDGNVERGRAVYVREKLQCVKCHRIGADGGEVGPVLTTIGTSAPVDYLVESLFWPDRKIKENFHSLIVATNAGQIITGIPIKKTADEIVLRNAENKLVSIPTRDVETSRNGGSIMPAGLLDSLPETEIVDLVRYLADLGKTTDSRTASIARHWLLHGPLSIVESAKAQARLFETDANRRLAWQDSLTTNDGWVYLREFALTAGTPVLFASADLNVAAPGRFRLQLRPADAKAWLDGKPMELPSREGSDAVVERDLSSGRHRLHFRIDLTNKPTQLRLEAIPASAGAKAAFAAPK